MNRFVLVAVAVLCLVGQTSPAPGQEGVIRPFPIPDAVKAGPLKVEDPPDDPNVPQIQFDLAVAEFRGTLPRDMLPGDLPWTPIHPLSSADKRQSYELVNERLQALTRHGRVDILSRPTFRTLFGLPAPLEIGGLAPSMSYLVRTGERTFEQKELQPTPPVGIKVDLTPRAVPGQPGKIEIRPLNVSITTLDGRQPIEGLHLDVGKPIISTRSLQSSLTLVQEDPAVVVLPGPPGRHALMFITARIAPPDHPVQPGEAFSDPETRERAIRERGLDTPTVERDTAHSAE